VILMAKKESCGCGCDLSGKTGRASAKTEKTKAPKKKPK
jgi:hypothetical protein